ncbi:MAG: hypothetical protein LIO68_08115 [Rikenellaceae bacterium]|nr:hypothetical protein [Rikenellaceae bacterium]
MRTLIKSLASMLAGCGLFVTTAQAQTSPSGSLDEALYRSVCERVHAPLVFSTRDTVFALSLPQDEPAEVYVQLTVGKNGKVKEKLTKVHANHIAGYVAPAFIAATKEMKVDKGLLSGMTGKDTSLLLTFPMEYQCVYDTINKEWPGMYRPNVPLAHLSYESSLDGTNSEMVLQKRIRDDRISTYDYAKWVQDQTIPTRVWYYLAFIHGQ